MASRRISFVVCFCLLLIPSLCKGTAESPRSSPAGAVRVAVTVNGHPGTFLLDTGANRTCLDTGFAARLALASANHADLHQDYIDGVASGVLIRDFGVGPFQLQNVAVLSTDLSSAFLRAGVSIDGILGTDVLRQFVVTVDFYSGSAQFKRNTTIPSSAKLVKLQQDRNLYLVPLSVQGTSVHLILDTGTNTTSISSAAWSRITMHWRPQLTLDGVRSTGGSPSAKLALIPRIAVGTSSSRNIPLRVQAPTQLGLFSEVDFEGLLGSDFLQRFIVTLDLANNRMYMTVDPRNHADPYLLSTIGIQFAKEADGHFTIMAVWNPSPAAAAGLKVGDVIVAVNHLDVQRMSQEDLSRELHGRPGTQVELGIMSAGQRREVPVAISCLLCLNGTQPRTR